MSQTWYVYLLRCSDNSLYAGVTTDITRRIKEHNKSNTLGAKYTRVRRPVSLAYLANAADRQEACKQEYKIRKLAKTKKEKLVSQYLANNSTS